MYVSECAKGLKVERVHASAWDGWGVGQINRTK